MKTVTLHISVPDDRYAELRDMLAKFPATVSDTLSFAAASQEFGIPVSTLTYWAADRKILPYSQPQPGGKKYVRRSDIRALLEVRETKKKAPKKRKTILNI